MRTKIIALCLSVLFTALIFVVPIRFGTATDSVCDAADKNTVRFNLTKYNIKQSLPSVKSAKPAANKSKSTNRHSTISPSKDMSFEKPQHSNNDAAQDARPDNAVITENDSPKDMSFDEPTHSENGSQAEPAVRKNQGGSSAKQIVYKPDFRIDKAPIYPAAARRMGQEGRVGLTVFVDRSGKILNVITTPSSGYPLLDNAAISAVKQWKFGSLNLQNQTNIIKTEVIFELN